MTRPCLNFGLARSDVLELASRMQLLPHTTSCFVCGEANALGLRLKFETDGRIVRSRFIPQEAHIGFKHTIHGGILATVLDEIMVWACSAQTQKIAYCAELTVRFQQPARPEVPLTIIAEMTSNRRNRLFTAKAEVRTDAGLLLCSATGKYLSVPEAEAAELMKDLVGKMPEFPK